MSKSKRPDKPKEKKLVEKAVVPETVSPAFKAALQTVAELDKKDKSKH